MTRDAVPVVVWSALRTDAGEGCPRGEPPFAFAILAPAHLAPGRASRWAAWALAPVVAVYRDLGVRAYLDNASVNVRDRVIANVQAGRVGVCAIMTAGLEIDGAAHQRGLEPRAIPRFRTWFREGLSLAASQWGPHGEAPAERAFESALRARIEAQHGWEFETAWPDAGERAALGIPRCRGEPAIL